MISRLPLRRLFLVVCVVFAAPTLLLAWLFYDGQKTRMAFSAKERAGVAYLGAVWPVFIDVAKGATPDLKYFSESGDLHNSAMGAWPQWRAFRLAIESSGNPQDKISAGVALIRAIGDGSNLILDPQLETYYLMDAVVLRLPVVVQELTDLAQQKSALNALNRQARESHRADLNAEIGQFIGDVSDTKLAFESAFRHGGDGALIQSLESRLTVAETQLNEVARAAERLNTEGANTPANRAVLDGRIKSAMGAIDELYRAALVELDALLRKRIDALGQALWSNILLAGIVGLLAAAMAITIATRISRVFTELAQRLHALSRGNVEIDIPYMDHSNEIGLIARSLKVFRDHALERLRLAEEIASAHVSRERDLERVAYYDDLTGLPNRKHLYRAFGEFLNHGSERVRGALLYLDMDRFKEINDTLGHQAGDVLIRTAAQRLTAIARPGDIVARISGDEFAILLPDVDEAEIVQHFGNRLLQRLSEPYDIHGSVQHLTASIGIALIARHISHDPDELLRRADVALYRAKQRGRNCCVLFDSVFDADVLYRKRIESSLRDAIQADQIDLAFQPQFCTKTRRIVGVEGLARWEDPKLGVVSPSVFIPVAENSGLIVDLGRSILRQAMMHAKRWPDLRVAVNLSVLQLRQKAFIDSLAMIAMDAGVDAGRIELELTESILLEDVDEVNATLRQVKSLGYRLALDDFGTGYSSLSYLTRFEFDKLKIDRSFVQNLEDSPHARTVMRSIAALGRAVGLEVCAEGVETVQQYDVVCDVGCSSVQGYLFMPAVPAARIDALLADGGLAPLPAEAGRRMAG